MDKSNFKIEKNEKLIAVLEKKKNTITNNYAGDISNYDNSIMTKSVKENAVPREGQALVYDEENKRWQAVNVYNEDETDALLALKVNKSGDTMTGDLHTSGYFRPDKIWHLYGGFQDESEVLSMSGWTQITNATTNLLTILENDGFTIAHDILTSVNGADYSGHITLTFIGNVSKDYHLRIYNLTQDTQMAYVVSASGLGVGNYQCLSLPLYIECDAGDQLQFEVMEDNDTAITLVNCVFYINYLHD